MSVDRPETIDRALSHEPVELKYSAARMIGLTILAVVAAALSRYAARAAPPGSFGRLGSLVGLPLFGACAVLFMTRLIKDRGKAVIRLTDTGFTDIRLAREEIPWRAIQAIGTHTIVLQKFLVLDVDPAFEATLSLTAIVRGSRKANAALGVTGLATTTKGLPLSHERLLALRNERWQPARGRVFA